MARDGGDPQAGKPERCDLVDDVHTFGEARPDLGQPWEDVTVDAVKELFPDRTLVVVDDGLVVL